MNPVLDQVERALTAAIHRRAARDRARHRAMVVVALATLALLTASVASALTGVGPIGGLFRSDGSITTGPEPVRGSPRAFLHAGGEGEAGWDLLLYRAQPDPHLAGRVPFYCLALARSDAKPIPRGGFKGPLSVPQRPGEVHGGLAACEYPRTLAARVWENGIDLDGGGNTPGSSTIPYFGLVRADAVELELRAAGEKPVAPELSPVFELKVPVSMKRRRHYESRAQIAATEDVPKVVRVRAFLAAFKSDAMETDPGIPRVVARALMPDGSAVTDTYGGRGVLPETAPPQLHAAPGPPAVRLTAAGEDGVRWQASGFKARKGGVCATASRASGPAPPGEFFCDSDGIAAAEVLVSRGIHSAVETGLRQGRPKGSYARFGVVRADVRRVSFPQPGGEPIVARVSRRWATVRWTDEELRKVEDRQARRALRRRRHALGVRLFLAVLPASVRDPQPVLRIEGGRRARP